MDKPCDACGHDAIFHAGPIGFKVDCQKAGCTCSTYVELTLELRQVKASERIADELAAIRSLMQGWDHNGAAVDVALYGGVISTEER